MKGAAEVEPSWEFLIAAGINVNFPGMIPLKWDFVEGQEGAVPMCKTPHEFVATGLGNTHGSPEPRIKPQIHPPPTPA